MNKRKYFCLFIFVVLVCSPFLSLFFQSVKADNTNLMSVTDGGWYDDMHWVNAPCPQYGEIINTTNTYGGSDSWQCKLSTNGWGVDHWDSRQNIAPGDTIYFSCWIKTSLATLSADVNNPIAGGRIGLDIYGSNSHGGVEDINAVAAPDGSVITWVNGSYVYPSGQTFVEFGTSTWTQVTIQFTVASTYQYINQYTGLSNPAGYQNGVNNVVPTFCIPWVQVFSCTQSTNEHGTAWFADPTFMIVPSGSSVSISPPSTSSASNVAATNITLEPTYTAHGQSFVESGFTLPVNVTVRNSGSVSEVAFVDLFANSTSICRVAVCLNSSASGILNCLVDTSSLPVGNYTISASVIPLDELSAAPSTITAGTVGITYVGDLNGDFQVNSMDIVAFVADYTACCSHGACNPAIDFNHDGKIDYSDIPVFLSAYIDYWKS
jgi:hypothetical protein